MYTDDMTLGEKQELFSRLLPKLLDKAHDLGFQVRIGDVFRDPRVHGEMGHKLGYGAKNSCHKLKLAVDLNLFLGKVYKTNTEDHRELGVWWEKQHPLCKWGGRMNDGNHYSLTHRGAM